MIKFMKFLFIRISLSLFFIFNINLIFASVNSEFNIPLSQMGSGFAIVPVQIGTIILIIFLVAIYFHKKIRKTKVDKFD